MISGFFVFSGAQEQEIEMTFVKILIACMFIARVLASFCCSLAAETRDSDVRDACRVTRYNDLCIHSLASYSNTSKRDPRLWARAGVSVAIGEAKQVAEHLVKFKNCRAAQKGRTCAALSDCIDLFQDTLDNLHRSLGALRVLSGQSFESQMEDVTTWVSAALTDEDTCLEGFTKGNKKQFKSVQNQVLNVTYVTSNALALVNKLATTGPVPTNRNN